MKQLYGVVFKKLIRWKFEYFDGKPNKFGAWNSMGSDKSTWAWCASKENLKYAIIEEKDFITRVIKERVRVDGYNFINFNWLAGTSFQPFSQIQEAKQPGYIIGLSLTTIDEVITVGIDGKISRRFRTDEEKAANLAGFGR